MKKTLCLWLVSLTILSFVSCDKKQGEASFDGPSVYFISARLNWQDVETRTSEPECHRLDFGLGYRQYLNNKPGVCHIFIGEVAKYDKAAILALKGKNLSFGLNKDQVRITWSEDGSFSMCEMPATGDSFFLVEDVIPAGYTDDGVLKFALVGSFQCSMIESFTGKWLPMINGRYTIMMAESLPL